MTEKRKVDKRCRVQDKLNVGDALGPGQMGKTAGFGT